MSDSTKKNQELSLSLKETAEKLRTIADGLEQGNVSINEETVPIALDTKIKISLKSKDNKVSIKLKWKPTNTSAPTEEKPLRKEVTDRDSMNRDMDNRDPKTAKEDALGEYTILKKRMSKDFGAIMKSCIKGQTIPEKLLVERFYQDSQAMCSYPDKGEEFYETYLKQAESLIESFKKADLEAMSLAITALGKIRKECHNRHK
ncbi:MAG: GAK system XXXCH domain-containing protein [Candidatus Scalindua sp. AMX11]|nr:MAG: GAK system XXXCH domain-containing protein [Candidatus Scalindua sp.]NOG84033.1 GAK system XXXCH domain-containing protein [Planctomycetota bacterium]RZV88100.1 MAG: GAK system XXXCH domain-containing protein [Candidatus Scalindua sp. SCAELEC01]TDE64034.1 MAG: GAK system XXXCH domain-containing protein [Candidatus Scalindua sp. AMX11]GJQ60904.1 MAG: hypothetical protein SCALA701_37050 [Candidatus Scalindua sp.]